MSVDIAKLRKRYALDNRYTRDPDVLALCDELETARARLAEARGLLFEREWIFLPGDGLICLVCGELKSNGHAPDCRLAAWLKEG